MNVLSPRRSGRSVFSEEHKTPHDWVSTIVFLDRRIPVRVDNQFPRPNKTGKFVQITGDG